MCAEEIVTMRNVEHRQPSSIGVTYIGSEASRGKITVLPTHAVVTDCLTTTAVEQEVSLGVDVGDLHVEADLVDTEVPGWHPR